MVAVRLRKEEFKIVGKSEKFASPKEPSKFLKRLSVFLTSGLPDNKHIEPVWFHLNKGCPIYFLRFFTDRSTVSKKIEMNKLLWHVTLVQRPRSPGDSANLF
jgi:hypothetical protein